MMRFMSRLLERIDLAIRLKRALGNSWAVAWAKAAR